MSMAPYSRYPGGDQGGYPSNPYGVGDKGGLSLGHFMAIVRRRRNLIAGITVAITVASAVYVNQLTPLYSAEATVVVEASRQKVLNVQSVVSGLRTDYYTNETEAAVIGSREIARKVVLKLNLQNSPYFNPDLAPVKKSVKGYFGEAISSATTWTRDLFSGGRYSAEKAERALRRRGAKSPAQQRIEAIETATDIFVSGLNVVPSRRSRVISVRYTSKVPDIASLAANTTVDIYILDQLESKGRATTRASQWLSQRAGELRKRVIASERRLETFRRQSGIVEVGGASIYSRQRAELDSQRVVARAKRAEAQARYAQVEKMLSEGAGSETIAAVLDSPLIQRLREQEAQVLRKIAEYKTQLRGNHPRMVLAQNELKDLEAKTRTEVKKIIGNLKNELEIAGVRERNLKLEIARLQKKLDEQHGAEVSLRALESEVKANKQLYETILTRVKETGVQDKDFQEADARVISRAITPISPFYPRKNFMIGAALVISIFMGLALSVLLEFLDNGFRSVLQLEGYTGVPALGIVPLVTAAQKRDARIYQMALDQSGGAFNEAIRTLRTGLLLSSAARPPKSVLLTSSVPGEGKTTTALSLGAMASKSGQRTIVVDCDMRHPSVHINLGYENNLGLADLLSGKAELGDVMEIEPRSGMRFITAGFQAPNPPDLLGSERMRELLQKLSEMFDLVILDGPPLLAVSDALVLVRNVDKVTYAVRWEKTNRQSVAQGLKQIIEAGASVAGTVLTQVDVRKHSQYDSGESSYRSYRNYYANE